MPTCGYGESVDLISTQQLLHLHALARHGSYARASDELGVSQSALSRSIQSMEGTLGARLVERERGRTGIELTERGREVLAHADEILTRISAIRNLSGLSDRRPLLFGIGPQYATILLPRVLQRMSGFDAQQPIDVTIGSTPAMMDLLLRGELEFFISGATTGLRPERVSCERFASSQLGLVVREGHPLLEASVTLDAIAEHPVYAGSAFRDRVRESDDLVRHALTPTIVLDSFEALVRLTANSDGILVSIPSIAIPQLVPLDFDLGRVVGPSETFLYSLRTIRLSWAAGVVINELKAGLVDHGSPPPE
jgi:molybdate transport repressor ModE-like protein